MIDIVMRWRGNMLNYESRGHAQPCVCNAVSALEQALLGYMVNSPENIIHDMPTAERQEGFTWFVALTDDDIFPEVMRMMLIGLLQIQHDYPDDLRIIEFYT